MYKDGFTLWDAISTQRAMAKIRLTVCFVYENKKIWDEVVKVREKFNIPKNFFKEYQVKHNSDYIDLLLVDTIKIWKKEHLKTESDEIQKNLANYLNNDSLFDDYNPKYINETLWSFIISAKLFEILPERILRCKSNLLYYHWPTVNGINNDVIQIEAYASTTEEEYKFIWSAIQKKQRIFKKNLYTRGKFAYKKHDIDKKAYELSQTTDKTHEKIAEEIKKIKEFEPILNKISYTYVNVPKSIKRYKKFIEEKFS